MHAKGKVERAELPRPDLTLTLTLTWLVPNRVAAVVALNAEHVGWAAVAWGRTTGRGVGAVCECACVCVRACVCVCVCVCKAAL